MNEIICTMKVSLKRLHESNVSPESQTKTAVSAKKTKLSTKQMTSSEQESASDHESDREALFGGPGPSKTTEQEANDDRLLDKIAQSLDESERTGEPARDKLAFIATNDGTKN